MNQSQGPEPLRSFRPPQEGEVIECLGRRYTLGRATGHGYFGAVFQCTDEWGNDLVAKVLLPQGRTYEQVRQEWLTELQNLKALRHPNITYVYDAFECRDTFYLIIERCAVTLMDLIGAPDLPGEDWLPAVSRDLLQAIDFIHQSGYVHKDISPTNVLVVMSREQLLSAPPAMVVFKVGDLGISRLESDINLFNTILAKWMHPPEFLDPEQFGAIGKPVDIYHGGLLLLSLLLGRIPQFTPEEIAAGEPRRLAERVPSRYAPAIVRALRRHVAFRTQTAIDFWRDLNQSK